MSAVSARNILLIGFMGTGKSSLARVLSRQTGCPLIDTDAEIEKLAGKSIAEIFAAEGEAHFRELESDVLRQQLDHCGYIISTGGGAVTSEENRRLLRASGLVVWLGASLEIIQARVARNTKRPLLQTPDPAGTLRHLLEKREPLYREVAHLQIDTGKMTRPRAAATILQAAGWQPAPVRP